MAISQTSKLLFKSQKQKIVWTLFFMIASGATSTMMVNAANTNSAIRLPGEDNQISLLNALHSDTGNRSFTTYDAYQIDVETYETNLKGVIQNANALMTRNCDILGSWNNLCNEDNTTCAIAEISKKATEDAMTLITQGFYTLGAFCELENFPMTQEIISRCYDGLPWTTSEGIAQQYPFLLQMMESFGQHVQRNKRFAVTGPIAIAIAIGLFSGTGAVAASVAITREEGHRISNEQNILRDLDSQIAVKNNLRNNDISRELGKAWDTSNYVSTLSAETMVNYHDAEELKHQMIFLVNKEEVLTFHDPATKQWRHAISGKIEKYSFGLTNSEKKEATRMTPRLTSMATSLLPLKPNSNKCRDTMLLKTLVIPVINFNQSKVFKNDQGLLKEYSDKDTYTLLSQDSVLSKETTLFKRKIQIIGRSCTVANSVNSSSTSSGNYLVENYKFTFFGQLTLTETCIVNVKNSTKDWTFTDEANISLPLTCSIKSDLINCGSVNVKSSKAKIITLKENRMKILKREHIEEKKATLTKDDYLTNPFTSKDLTIRNVWNHPLGGVTIYQWIIIGIAAIAASALGLWCYCRTSKTPKTASQPENSTNIEMKNYYSSEMPAYLHPETQHKTPDAPPRPTTDKGTSPKVRRKTKYERMADKQVRDDPFQMITSSDDFEEAKLKRKRLEAGIGTSK